MHHRPKDRFQTENVTKLHEHNSRSAMNVQTCTNTCNEERQEENKQKRARMERCITKHVLLLQKFVQNIISIVKGKNAITEEGGGSRFIFNLREEKKGGQSRKMNHFLYFADSVCRQKGRRPENLSRHGARTVRGHDYQLYRHAARLWRAKRSHHPQIGGLGQGETLALCGGRSQARSSRRGDAE